MALEVEKDALNDVLSAKNEDLEQQLVDLRAELGAAISQANGIEKASEIDMSGMTSDRDKLRGDRATAMLQLRETTSEAHDHESAARRAAAEFELVSDELAEAQAFSEECRVDVCQAESKWAAQMEQKEGALAELSKWNSELQIKLDSSKAATDTERQAVAHLTAEVAELEASSAGKDERFSSLLARTTESMKAKEEGSSRNSEVEADLRRAYAEADLASSEHAGAVADLNARVVELQVRPCFLSACSHLAPPPQHCLHPPPHCLLHLTVTSTGPAAGPPGGWGAAAAGGGVLVGRGGAGCQAAGGGARRGRRARRSSGG
jgi:chromosome segregation ATPase